MKNPLLALLSFVAIISSCGKKSDPKPEPYTINQKTISLNFDKEQQFKILQGSINIDPSKVKFSSSSEITGTIDSKGLFKARRIGTTTIKAEIESTILVSEVTVTPYSTMVQEPYQEYSASKTSIKSKEKRAVVDESPDGILYKGENTKVENVYYGFENGAMNGAVVVFKSTEEIIKEVLVFYSERYNYLAEDRDVLYFRDQNSVIAISYNTSIGFNAVYIKNTTGTSSVEDLNTLKRIFSASKQETKLKQLLTP